MWCQVAHHPSSMSILLWCIAMGCQVASHPTSMSILLWLLLCDVKSHATHQCQFFCDVLLCDVKSHTTLHQCQFFNDILLGDVNSHTTLHQCQFFCDILLGDVKSHTTLHQCQVSQFYLSVTRKYFFPTSFDNLTKMGITNHVSGKQRGRERKPGNEPAGTPRSSSNLVVGQNRLLLWGNKPPWASYDLGHHAPRVADREARPGTGEWMGCP